MQQIETVRQIRQLLAEIDANTKRVEREREQAMFQETVAANDDCCCGKYSEELHAEELRAKANA